MAISGLARVYLPSFECRSDPDFSGNEKPSCGKPNSVPIRSRSGLFGLNSSLILRFPPKFVRQLSNKARRNCSNIGVAQVVAASWSNNNNVPNVAAAVDVVAEEIGNDENVVVVGDDESVVGIGGGGCNGDSSNDVIVQLADLAALKASFLCSDGSIAVHAGERLGRGISTDGITTPVVNTSAYWFKNSDELVDFKMIVLTSPTGFPLIADAVEVGVGVTVAGAVKDENPEDFSLASTLRAISIISDKDCGENKIISSEYFVRPKRK
ncbi:hypothetical protein GIB67_011921 [Kingdonia uniflora]|uniref:Uncharacterized protein n=1 Tax=Kingdonia uniflora TaxID=39325 RepID=A0A7J7LZS5_9MAGN|nr:hypothetical protein GIB67_011921 [Kingdonia uniflora]